MLSITAGVSCKHFPTDPCFFMVTGRREFFFYLGFKKRLWSYVGIFVAGDPQVPGNVNVNKYFLEERLIPIFCLVKPSSEARDDG